MSAIVDTQLPPRLARFLKDKGWDAVHTTFFENGQNMTDTIIAQISLSQNLIIITKDNDFFDLYLVKSIAVKVLLLKFGNIRNSDLIAQFNIHNNHLLHLFETGARFVFLGPEGIVQY